MKMPPLGALGTTDTLSFHRMVPPIANAPLIALSLTCPPPCGPVIGVRSRHSTSRILPTYLFSDRPWRAMGRRARANLMVLGFDDALWRSVISECRFHNLPSPCTTEFASLSKLHQVSVTTAWTAHSLTHSRTHTWPLLQIAVKSLGFTPDEWNREVRLFTPLAAEKALCDAVGDLIKSETIIDADQTKDLLTTMAASMYERSHDNRCRCYC